MHAYRLTKSVLLQIFSHAISNSKIEVSLYAMKVEVNIKGLCKQLFKSTQSTHNLYYNVMNKLALFHTTTNSKQHKSRWPMEEWIDGAFHSISPDFF